MIKTLLVRGAVVAILLFSTACSTDDSISLATEESVQRFEEAGLRDMKNDALFAAEATSASMLQVQLAELASTKAVSPEVKALGRQLEQDHQRVLEDLRNMANQSSFVLPDSLGSAHQEVYNEVYAKSGIEFDLSYIKQTVDQHEDLVKRYQDMADNAKALEVQQFASKQLPLLRSRLQRAETLEDRVSDI
ncbi:DUF4142 domain-containing protein [Pontibacter silvestris]|uniref:DUF4142 domain-containing protein n=1 Tax=Pontibacter silvestris TaxID=2305183 RepID=A0ABW4WWA4_9BACT|nr:DUF4142 domain-containing protein [Pontibacter silvestris]MCC9136566.1 DUF4142 domain-containing protein [Pontibacter silvestris]